MGAPGVNESRHSLGMIRVGVRGGLVLSCERCPGWRPRVVHTARDLATLVRIAEVHVATHPGERRHTYGVDPPGCTPCPGPGVAHQHGAGG